MKICLDTNKILFTNILIPNLPCYTIQATVFSKLSKITWKRYLLQKRIHVSWRFGVERSKAIKKVLWNFTRRIKSAGSHSVIFKGLWSLHCQSEGYFHSREKNVFIKMQFQLPIILVGTSINSRDYCAMAYHFFHGVNWKLGCNWYQNRNLKVSTSFKDWRKK